MSSSEGNGALTTLDTYTLALFVAGLLAGVGITLTAQTTPALIVAIRTVYHYGRRHPTWGMGFALVLILAELGAASILFRS